MLKGNVLIAQSGGPTPVINASLVGAIKEARSRECIAHMYGSLNACEGMLKQDNSGLVDLFAQGYEELEAIVRTPSAALCSSRKKLVTEDKNGKGKTILVRDVLDAIKRLDVRYFFYIGGNDSADNCRQVNEEAMRQGYALRAFHIPKTIDNDLLENDHTPGYGSAAKYVACAFIGDDLDNLALPGVKINVVMGRNAGFLVGAAALAKARNCSRENDGPHLIYFPEREFKIDKFLADVAEVYSKNKRALIAVSEGIVGGDRVPIGFNGKYDGHGNHELDGILVAQRLAKAVAESGITSRVRADVLGYIPRSFPLTVPAQDFNEAELVGREAVRAAVLGEYESGSIALKRQRGREYRVYTKVVGLEKVAKNTRKMPDEFINADGNNVTRAFLDYASPLVGELPATGRLKMIPVIID